MIGMDRWRSIVSAKASLGLRFFAEFYDTVARFC
jgi:hypothetical protein